MIVKLTSLYINEYHILNNTILNNTLLSNNILNKIIYVYFPLLHAVPNHFHMSVWYLRIMVLISYKYINIFIYVCIFIYIYIYIYVTKWQKGQFVIAPCNPHAVALYDAIFQSTLVVFSSISPDVKKSQFLHVF